MKKQRGLLYSEKETFAESTSSAEKASWCWRREWLATSLLSLALLRIMRSIDL